MESTPGNNFKWSEAAIQLLQSASENEMIDLFRRGNDLAVHARRAGITAEDIKLARKLQQPCKVPPRENI